MKDEAYIDYLGSDDLTLFDRLSKYGTPSGIYQDYNFMINPHQIHDSNHDTFENSDNPFVTYGTHEDLDIVIQLLTTDLKDFRAETHRNFLNILTPEFTKTGIWSCDSDKFNFIRVIALSDSFRVN